MKKKSIFLLILFNGILLSAGWGMTFYAYPRLPQKIPLWLNFSGQQTILTDKSLLFFLYPAAQTLFFIFFLLMIRIMSSRSTAAWKSQIMKEVAYLALIFFNLIFIHVQRSLILLAHQVEEGVHRLYFYSLFVILLGLIPYYRMRIKLYLRK